MKIFIIVLMLPFSLFCQTQEKRLALVIGNSNYDKGPLNNPVNDALLMARTLDSLDFDVIIDTNIANKENFIRTIREFGNKRSDYDVAFVYYAGHGIQVGAENFLLPTKVNFETEYDVMDFGVSVQNIMRYLTGMTNQVNILVLDACRDNPFEGNWNKTRSLKGGGLAKIPPPTGSLIAFSTDAGNTAADGNGENSIYCQSLCKNMMLDNTSLDQVFRNVRSDVLKITNGNQRPIEASQLTGQAFYLVKSDYEIEFSEIRKLIKLDQEDSEQDHIGLRNIDRKDALKALEITSSIISNDTGNIQALILRGEIYYFLKEYDNAIINYQKAFSIDTLSLEATLGIAYSYEEISKYKEALKYYDIAIDLDNSIANTFHRRSILFGYYLDDFGKGIADCKKSIDLKPEFWKPYSTIAALYLNIDSLDLALKNSLVAKKLREKYSVKTHISLFNKDLGEIYYKMKNYEEAIKYYLIAADHNDFPRDIDRMINFEHITFSFFNIEKYEKALEFANKNLILISSSKDIESSDNYLGFMAEAYKYKAVILEYFYQNNKSNFLKNYSLLDIKKAYNNVISYKEGYKYPSYAHYLYADFLEKVDKKLSVFHYQEGIRLDSLVGNSNCQEIFNFGSSNIYGYKKSTIETAIYYLKKSFECFKNKKDITGDENLSLILYYIAAANYYIGNSIESENYINLAIELDSAKNYLADYYTARGKIYFKNGYNEKAKTDFENSLKINPNVPYNYLQYAIFLYQVNDIENALIQFNKAVQIDTSASSLVNRAKFYIKNNEFKKAKIDLISALEIDAYDAEIYYYTANVFNEEAKFLYVIDNMKKAISNYDGSYITNLKDDKFIIKSDIYVELGNLYRKIDYKDLMCDNYEKACELGDCEMFEENCK